ncbi:MAG: GAF domain-containing protein [Gemmatimonadetes bacterium]|nr:GAF domain-containing protein [Gemmatimonadota bacterium]
MRARRLLLVMTTPESMAPPSDPLPPTDPAVRARELLQALGEAGGDREAAWELTLLLDSLAEDRSELNVRVQALEVENRALQERLDLGHKDYAQLRASMDELLNLHELSEAISTSLNLEDAFDALMRLSARVVDFDAAGIFALDREGARLDAMALRGQGEQLEERLRSQWDDGIVDWVLRERRPIVFDDIESAGDICFVLIPLLVRGKDIGLFALHCTRAKDDFTLGEIELLGVLANQTAAAIENSRLYTDLESAHGRLKESQRQVLLSAKQAAIGELAGGVAHEVNNPLQIILSRVQLMVVKHGDDERLRDGLALIENNVKRISRIIRALLGFATHNRTDAEGQPFALETAIQQACALTRHQMESKLIEVDVQIQQDMPSAVGSVGELEQVFINLILNAANAMGSNGHLSIDAHVEDQWLEARIADTGEGIEPEHLDRIFEPFFTTRADEGGTGLGLAVSYRIVENYGGSITVDSEPGTGSTFIVRLPVPGAVPDSAPDSDPDSDPDSAPESVSE